MKFENYSEDDKNIFVNGLEDNIKKMTALQSLLFGNELTAAEIPYIREFKSVADFLDSELNSKKETDIKKIFVTAIVKAVEKGVLPFPLPTVDPIVIANLVDEGLTRLKVAYQQSKGILDVEEAVNALIDRAAARAIASVDKLVDTALPILADKLSKVMLRNPYTAPLAPLVEIAVPYVAPVAKSLIKKGITVAQNYAKSTVTKIFGKAKEFLDHVQNNEYA